jgi:hypothetical protein
MRISEETIKQGGGGWRNKKVKEYLLFIGLWTEAEKRKQFFVDYAKANGFDHLNAESWYSSWHKIWTLKVRMLTFREEGEVERQKKTKKTNKTQCIFIIPKVMEVLATNFLFFSKIVCVTILCQIPFLDDV